MNELNFNLFEIKDDLLTAVVECNKRGLIHSSEYKMNMLISNSNVYFRR